MAPQEQEKVLASKPPAQDPTRRAEARDAFNSAPCRNVTVWIFFSFLVFYIGLTRGRFISTDEIELYQAAQSLWERGSLSIQCPEGTPGRGGLRYPVANSGMALASAPLYGLGKGAERILRQTGGEEWVRTFAGPVINRAGGDRWGGEVEIFFVDLFNCFVTALLCALFFLFSLRLGAAPPWALLSTALLGLASYIAPFSTGFYQHPAEALLLLAAFYFLFRDREGPHAHWRWLAGLSVALSLQMRFPSLVSLPALALYHGAVIWRRRPLDRGPLRAVAAVARQLAPFAAAVAAGFLLHALDQFLKFGTIRTVGRYAATLYDTPLWYSLYAYFFSPGDSILFFSPLLALTPWTFPHFARRFGLEALFILLALGSYLVLYGRNDSWHGLYCLGPRYLAATTPLLMLPLGPWMQHRGRGAWFAVAPLALAGLWVQAIHFLVDFWKVALYENYLSFQPKNGFLFIPGACQLVTHSKALLAWNGCVDTWLVMVYRNFGPIRLAELTIPLAALLAGCLWQLGVSFPAQAKTAREAAPMWKGTLRPMALFCMGLAAAAILAMHSSHLSDRYDPQAAIWNQTAPEPDAESYLSLSLSDYRSGKYAEAITAAEHALELKPDYAEAYNNIGASWNSLGQYDRGAMACEQALKLNPDFPLARNNLIYAIEMGARQGKPEQQKSNSNGPDRDAGSMNAGSMRLPP